MGADLFMGAASFGMRQPITAKAEQAFADQRYLQAASLQRKPYTKTARQADTYSAYPCFG